MVIKKILIICVVFLTGISASTQPFASGSPDPDPSFKEVATFFPIDGGEIQIGNIDREKKTFRIHLRHFGKNSERVYYYASADVFMDENGEEESDNAEACIEYPQYTRSVIGDTYRRARVRLLFSLRGEGNGLFELPGHVIYQKCTTNINRREDWNCTGWEYLGRLPGF